MNDPNARALSDMLLEALQRESSARSQLYAQADQMAAKDAEIANLTRELEAVRAATSPPSPAAA